VVVLVVLAFCGNSSHRSVLVASVLVGGIGGIGRSSMGTIGAGFWWLVVIGAVRWWFGALNDNRCSLKLLVKIQEKPQKSQLLPYVL